ncbi:MBL fold metallo-hydrolase [Hufsiella ginkgonis]|uniref:MBL fold metallo-hydrolase n=1 Tax=Hufsiella ginkgonis TaxID=2695274 RepID=A0A7K1XXQ4_9SPHI|nr:MBL fold metallo-hydrolase [Hufsiella ginkgonis]MXV15713.1 MBL fold metallo-hydrolase [Hufsiella ginkgonis]
MSLLAAFGSLPSGKRLEQIKQSPNYRDGSFQNPVPTEVTLKEASLIKLLFHTMNKPASVRPPFPLPSVKTDLAALGDERPAIVWFGHSSYMIRFKGKTILVDPVFSGNASPVSFIAKAFAGTDVYDTEDFVKVDILVITHDHYDHLDYKTVIKLAPKVEKICTSLGVGAHLERWGIDPGKITEFDWFDSAAVFPEVTLTAVPGRHFSGRGIKRGQSLWSAFVLKWERWSLFIGGDSGYGDHFKAIGARFGPFDIAMLETGQYNKDWPYIHMHPQEAVQAALDLQAKVLMPVHWGKFDLAFHPWDEPAKLTEAAANEKKLRFTMPLIGEPVILDLTYPASGWWREKPHQDA